LNTTQSESKTTLPGTAPNSNSGNSSEPGSSSSSAIIRGTTKTVPPQPKPGEKF